MAKSTRKNFSLVRELMQTRVVMMEENALHAYRTRLIDNFNGHVSADDISEDILPAERHAMLCYRKDGEGRRCVSSVLFFNDYNVLVEESSDGELVEAHDPYEDEERLLVLYMDGPVTRCGGMCSQGSMDYRDLLLEHASDDTVKGLVLVTDTPGGTAFALHDFEQGMEAWDEAGKFSIQWIDGMDCSAGVACGVQCQKIVAYNRHDIVGCIGAMMAGWTTADGTVDSDGNRYIDITASQTPDKNGEFRAAAEGDYAGLQKEVDACCEEFLRIIDKCRPQVKAEHRTGHTYEAGDVIGSLVDGIASFDDACHYALTGEALWDAQTGSGEPSPSEPIEPTDPTEPGDSSPSGATPAEPGEAAAPSPEPGDSSLSGTIPTAPGDSSLSGATATNQSSINMTLLEKIAAALGVKADADAPAQQETITEEVVNQMRDQIAQYEQQVQSITSDLENCRNLLADCKSDIEQKEAEIGNLNESLTQKEAEIGNLNESLTQKEAEIANLNESLTQKEAEIGTITDELNELRSQAPAAPVPAPAVHVDNKGEDIPEELHDGMTAQEIIAYQKRVNALRRK